MPDFNNPHDERFRNLEKALHSIEQRLAALEGASGFSSGIDQQVTPPTDAQTETQADDLLTPEAVKGGLSRLPYLFGRAFLVFCGAFILRALTESETMMPLIGTMFGMGYGLFWLALSYRSAQQSQRLAALFHGITAVMITYPLIFEVTTRYNAISAGTAIACITVLTLISLATAALSQQRALAWAVTIAAMAVTMGLLISTHRIGELAFATLTIAIGSLWVSERNSWHAIRWPIAMVADLLVLQMTVSLSREGGPPEVFSYLQGEMAIAAALGLVVVYAGGLALVTLRNHRLIQPFEVLQTAVVILVGFGGAFRLASLSSIGAGALLAAELIVGAVCYAVAFVFVDRQLGRGRNFLFYTSVAIALTIHGLMQTGPAQSAIIALWSLALIAAVLGGRFDRITLRTHAAIYLVTAASISGWLESSAAVIFTSGSDPSPFRFFLFGGAIVASLVYLVLAMTRRRFDGSWWSRLPAATAALIATIGWGSLAIRGLAEGLNLGTGVAGSTSIARMAVISVAAALAAFTARNARFSELGWLCPLILFFGGARLLLVDVWKQPPGALVFSFAFFGAALIISPRMLRSHRDGDAVS